MGRMFSKCLRWLLAEAADWLMAAWLLAGLAAIIFFLSDNLPVCIAVVATFIGVTLFIYFRFARVKG